MENRSNRKGEELAATKAKFYGFPSSPRPTRNTPPEALNLPSIQIGFEADTTEFQSGDFLSCEYHVSESPEHAIQAIETSVIWLTEGKGDSDIGVHCFERRQKQALNSKTFNQPQRISTVLPASPLSYEGDILKIRWCVRVRLFLAEGEQITEDQYFQLGRVQRFSQSDMESGNLATSNLDPNQVSDTAADNGPD